ncbi:hypothetical protein ZIOFF_073579 [Zingiber officinale]|uniref:Uncharacterized protein n=1 Tax=Zingiber officinale TaxID=94328 RepID=A0A8J5ESS8_ZINOF|nr:hypothetical protein ZIOFF_073579 [Zingiber officinale]
MTRSQKMTRSQTSNWNGSRYLYETKGTYGYGNVIWPTETIVDGENVQPIERIHKPWLLYFLVFIRMVCLGLFLGWRIRHKNEDAIWTWGISIVCEFWFTFSWLLDQLPKLCPLDRATDLVVLKEKFETATFNNPTGKSDLPGIDSIAEAVSFANIWVPFCRKHGIEPRNPESYFNLKKYSYKNRVHTDFVNDRRRVREEIKTMKQRIEVAGDDPVEPISKATWMANGTHWPGTWINPFSEHTEDDHAGVIQLQGRPLADHPAVKYGRQPGILTYAPRELVDASTVAEALSVISCWYEDETEWGQRVGWIYGSVIGDTVTGCRMHDRGWKSVYCVTKPDAFDLFSRNNALLASSTMKILQRVAYLNVGIYPFTSIFLVVYCFLPALSLLTGQFIVQTLNVTFLMYRLLITLTLCMLSILETMWSGITFKEWWRYEQFWMIGGTSAHFGAVLQRFLKLIAGIEISFTPTWKLADGKDGEFPDTSLMILPITIMMANLIAIAVGISRTIHNTISQWSKLLGGVSFSFWVWAHLYPVAKGLVEQRGRNLIMVFQLSSLLSITLLLSF